MSWKMRFIWAVMRHPVAYSNFVKASLSVRSASCLYDLDDEDERKLLVEKLADLNSTAKSLYTALGMKDPMGGGHRYAMWFVAQDGKKMKVGQEKKT